MSETKIKSGFNITLEEMAANGLHFGHRTFKLHPKMKPYVFGIKRGIHIINLEKTLSHLEKALEYIAKISSEGKILLLVGTKIQHRDLIKSAASETNLPHITERWLGGFLTNFLIMRKRVVHLKELREKISSVAAKDYTKKELAKMGQEIHNLEIKFGGVESLESLPEAVFICDIERDKIALEEARSKKVPVIAITDTNTNPNLVDYPIPANDDAVLSVKYILEKIKETVLKNKPKVKETAKEK